MRINLKYFTNEFLKCFLKNDSLKNLYIYYLSIYLSIYLFILQINFDKLKVPTVPFQLPTSKSYYGLKEMMESELDFLKATVLSKSTAPVIMYSDMPMKEMAKDPEFPKKWMFGMAMLLKKGLHINMIPDLTQWQATGVSLTEF